MAANMETYRNVCKLLFEIHDISTFFLSPAGETIFEFADSPAANPLYQNDKQQLLTSLAFEPNRQYAYPMIRRTHFLEYFTFVSALSKGTFLGTLVIGPTLPYNIPEHKIKGMINDFLETAHRERVLAYYRDIPVMSKEKLIKLSIFLHYIINQTLLSFEEVSQKNNLFKQITEEMKPTHLFAGDAVQLDNLHHDPLLEKQLLTIIKEGRTEELGEFTKLDEETTGVLSKSSHVRSKKNLGIVAIAIATRAAIDGGLDSEMAFSLSDHYIQRLETLTSIKDIDKLQTEAIFTFTRRVSEVKAQKHIGTITTCKKYIYTNRFEKITHDDVANSVHLSHSYLSVLFKKEVGISVRSYIQKVKIEEAKNLLAYTNIPISEISSLLHFTDQSYFTKVFKKFAGITPKQYKEKHHIL
ncbi:helix-turn-helix domain-containing protein [Terribacillus saccharophilus]|uniref:helix-turn-helix domain-containing protein n=1 Tax=Terribacillus saccharophilus TaxID=361277 RepID=UPI00398288D2